ncbi:MAG: M14 family metallopeptidase, partial [Longimonas sp.]|uniref:M14 family metallopeptidase n=1 Tax=Longimonas sp. TaxID=2039626 RepID=UPI0033606CB8
IDEIKAQNQALSSNPESVSDADLANLPTVVYMGYSIHGDEASGTEAAILLLYHLAAGDGPAIDAVLDNVVTIIDPVFNPDGRDRFVNWVNGNRGGTPTIDGQDREHNQPWPGGRTNHYWFDLNRDWMPVQHPSSQARIALYQDWRPQVLTDFHEMGSEDTYFFQPGIPSRTNPNTPDINQELTAELAEYHADFLDDIGSLYYTRERFDDFYYGKGSTYPDVQGTVGILFEQASSRALLNDTRTGVMSYAYTVRNQFLASLSTLQGSSEIREDLLRYQRDFFANRSENLSDAPMTGYLIDMERYPQRAQALGQLLLQHRVELFDLGQAVESDGRTYRPGSAYWVPLDQEQGQFVKGVMERQTTFQDSLFYDVSTWTLPLAFGTDHSELTSTPSGVRGERIDAMPYTGGAVTGGQAEVAYVMPWGRYFAPRALYQLQDADITTRMMPSPFEALVNGSTRTFDRGAIIIPLQQHNVSEADVHEAVQAAAEAHHVEIVAINRGLTPTGPDLGSSSASVLEKPEVAVVSGTTGRSRWGGASAANAGEVWHLLSERFDMPVSMIDISYMESLDLSEYNTLVLAGGSYNGMDADQVKDWVREGGHLIASHTGAHWATAHELVELEAKTLDLDSLVAGQDYADLGDARGAHRIGGSIFEATLDTTHPLAFGYDETIPVFRRGTQFYEPHERPGRTVATYTDSPLLSGYISDPVEEIARESAAIVSDRHGSGQVTLLMDNPNFRAFWYGTNGLFLNALFFGSAL